MKIPAGSMRKENPGYGRSRNIPKKGPLNRRSLGFAPPDFLWSLVALANYMRLSFKRKAHTRLCPVQRGRKSGSG